MIGILKRAILALFAIYKSTIKATLHIFKETKRHIRRKLELDRIENKQKRAIKYVDKAFYIRSMIHDNQCSHEKAVKFNELAKKYEKKSRVLNLAANLEFDKYNYKYYGGEKK